MPILLILVEVIVSLTTPGPDTTQGWIWLLAVIGVIGGPLFALAALIVGIIAVLQRRGRLFGAIAIVLAVIELLYGARADRRTRRLLVVTCVGSVARPGCV